MGGKWFSSWLHLTYNMLEWIKKINTIWIVSLIVREYSTVLNQRFEVWVATNICRYEWWLMCLCVCTSQTHLKTIYHFKESLLKSIRIQGPRSKVTPFGRISRELKVSFLEKFPNRYTQTPAELLKAHLDLHRISSLETVNKKCNNYKHSH